MFPLLPVLLMVKVMKKQTETIEQVTIIARDVSFLSPLGFYSVF